MALRDAGLFALRPAQVLPTTVDDHLDEAGWAMAARSRMLADVDGDAEQPAMMSGIIRQEELLRGHLAGLASIWSARLEHRLGNLLSAAAAAPEQLTVAAFLLLRCARPRWQPKIVMAWQRAQQRGDSGRTDALGNAMRLASGPACDRTSMQPDPIAPDDVAAIVRHIEQHNFALAPRLARRLAIDAPHVVCALTRLALARGSAVCEAQLGTLAAMMPAQGPRADEDFSLLVFALAQKSTMRAAAGALWLCGSARAAELYLALTHEHHDAIMRARCAQGFEYLTGLMFSVRTDDDGSEEQFDTDEMAPRYRELRLLQTFAQPLLRGRPRDTDAIIAIAPDLSVTQWHNLLLLTASRSRGEVIVDPCHFFVHQLHALRQRQTACDHAVFAAPASHDTSAIAQALMPLLQAGPR